MKRAAIATGIVLGLGAVGLAVSARRGPAVETSAAQEPSAPLRCAFRAGETGAFAFASNATLEDRTAEDRFEGVLSFVVVEGTEGKKPAVLRAALASVTLEQRLSEEKASADELADGPFYVRVDSTCRFGELGFSPRWSVASRHLVEGLFESAELVLSGGASSTRWEAEQRDGIGSYTGQYEASSSADGVRRVVRTKPSYHADVTLRQLGIRVQVLGARAEGRFSPARPALFEEVAGREHVRLHFEGREPQGFVHTWRMKRDDARYQSPSDALALADADFGGGAASEARPAPARPDPALANVDHDAALARFHGFFRESGKRGIHPAARHLAEWLRAHPEQSARLLEDLKRGAIAEEAHSALFLALELAGTKESRQVLGRALDDARLSEVDRARAAAALADHGEPSRETADLLAKRGGTSGSSMVANASLLGLGRLAARTHEGDPLRGELRSMLEAELRSAETEDAAIVAIDALGNSRDGAFATALADRLGSDHPALRAHAAEALGRLPADVARPHLVAKLETEQSARVSAAIARSLGQMPGPLTDAELAVAAHKLATSTSADERAAIIDWLGSARDQAGARQVLAAHFAAEPNVGLQQRIGRFVGPADLRVASR